ncbi:MAG TPA: hypothetical protein VHT52_23965 [Stellaceae bacterium]|nr:hypothetical protein [Stellaceae bacterium]
MMIERASRYAEKAVADSGGIAAMWHAVTEDGRDVIMPPPKCDKDIAALLVRIVLQNINAVRVVFIDECWSVRIEGRDVDALVARAEAWIAEYGSLADFEGQQEVVSFTAEDADGYVLCGWREIIRCDGTMTLGPLVVEQPDYSEGRFVGMLEPKDTRQ